MIDQLTLGLLAITLMLTPFGRLIGLVGTACGAEFRIENKVYVDDEKRPPSSSVTLFSDDMVYDILDGAGEIIIFDRAHGRFVLLDPAHRLRTEISVARLQQAMEQLRAWANTQPDPFLRFLAAPKFDRQGVTAAGEMEFASPWATYQVMPQDPANGEIARAYQDFSNEYCQLNTLINPGARPPFARMIVNDALGQRKLTPREVKLTIRPKEGLMAKRTTIRSQHQLAPRLSEADRQQIARAEQFVTSFTLVLLDEYQKRVRP
jgi:hypothetical protein